MGFLYDSASFTEPNNSDADIIREYLRLLEWSQHYAASQLEIEVRLFRTYCTMQTGVPMYVFYALEHLKERNR
jgi:hypothetical protein